MTEKKTPGSGDPLNFFDNEGESIRFINLIMSTINQYAETREYLTVNEIVFGLESIISNLGEAYGGDDYYLLGS